MISSRGAMRLGAILFLRLALGAAFLGRTGVFNAPDEPAHFYYIDALAASGRLPAVDLGRSKWSYESNQPPLYYALAAPIARALRGFPLKACVIALRWQNLAISLINVAAIFFLGSLVAGEAAGLGAAAFAAFLPQYLFIGSTVTNDGLADLCSTGFLYLAARELEDGGDAPLKAGWLVGGVTGLALLSKLTSVEVLAGFPPAYVFFNRGPKLRALARLAGPAAVAAAMSGWFYARNIRLYGDAAGYGSMTYESAMAPAEIGSWCVGLFKSFWGVFAWMASPLPGFAYAALAAACGVAAAGFGAWWRENGAAKDPVWRFFILTAALALAQVLSHGFLHTRQPQGRFLFPLLGPISLAAALGGARALRGVSAFPRRATCWLGVGAVGWLEWLSWRAL